MLVTGGIDATDIPLLPLMIELRRRPLHPLRFSLRWLLLMVAVSGTFFFLVGEARRLAQTTSYHAIRAVEITKDRSPSYDPTPMSRWHSAMAQQYRDAWERLDLLLSVFIMAIGTVIVVGVLGRVLAGFDRSNEPSVSTGFR
jgi:hypothetical protein